MRVLQAMAGAAVGGAEAFFTRLAGALARAGLDQRIVIRAHEGRRAALRAAGLEPVELRFGGFFDWRTRRTLKREIEAYGPDVVLTWMNRASAICPEGDFVHVGRLGGYYDLKYYRTCDHLIGNTPDIVDYVAGQGWPRDRVHYLPNFVAGEAAEPIPRRQFYTPEGAPLVVALGRLHVNKAFDVLLEAVSRVPDVYLWIAGDGPLRKDLEALAEKFGVKPRVRFLGWRDDPAAVLATGDLFVCPSRHEPLGNVILEAWSQGIPVVAADSYGPGTLIEHRETGLLVPVDDAQTMGRAIRSVLEDDDLRRRIARQGREAFERDFTEETVVGQYLEFFDRVRESG